MNAHHGFNIASPILSDRDNWVFDGPGVDPFIANCQADADAHALELNSDRQKYAVVRFNTVEGTVRDVTDEFWREIQEDDDGYEVTRETRLRMNRMWGMFP